MTARVMVSVVILTYLWGVDMKLKNKYRLVAGYYSGYEAQVKYWFFPLFWFQIGFTNTPSRIKDAKRVIEVHKSAVVEYVD